MRPEAGSSATVAIGRAYATRMTLAGLATANARVLLLRSMASSRRLTLAIFVLVLAAVAATVGHAGSSAPAAQRWIVFAAHPNGGPGPLQLVRVRVDGTGLSQITTGSKSAIEPDFSPDGKSIAFARLGSGIFRMNADGSGLRRLTSGRARRLPGLVARRQEDRVPAAVQERLAPVRHVPDGCGPAKAAAGAARGAAVLDAEQQVDPDPVGRRPRSGRRPDRDDPAVLRPDDGHPDLAERHRLAERPDDRVPRAAAQHRPGGLRGGAVPAVRRSIWRASLRPTVRGGSSTTPVPQAGRPTGRR